MLQRGQEQHRMGAIKAAHVKRRLQAGAYGWPPGMAEYLAAVVVTELDAAHPGRLAVWHAGDH